MRTLHAQVLDELGRRIVSGEFPEGQKLPPEDQLAAQLGVSKGGVREVVKSLLSKGLVTVRPRLGTVVAERTKWSLFDPEVLRWHESQPDKELPRQLMQLRSIVEPEAARLACDFASEEALDEMVQLSEQMVQAYSQGDAGRSALFAADLKFHQLILESTGNEFIAQLSRLLEGALKVSFDRTFHLPGSVAAGLPLHADIARCMKNRDPEGAAASSRTLLISTLHELEA